MPILNAILIVITNIVNIFAGLLGYTGDVAQSVSAGAKGWEDYGNSIEKAQSKANKSLRSFDKLNNITTPSASTTSGGTGGINKDLYKAMQDTNREMLEISNKAQKIAESIMEWLGFTKKQMENGNTQKLLLVVY